MEGTTTDDGRSAASVPSELESRRDVDLLHLCSKRDVIDEIH